MFASYGVDYAIVVSWRTYIDYHCFHTAVSVYSIDLLISVTYFYVQQIFLRTIFCLEIVIIFDDHQHSRLCHVIEKKRVPL